MLKKRARPELQELNMHSPVVKLTVSGIAVVLAGCTPLGLNPSNAGSPGLVNQVGYLCDTGERLTVSYFSHRGAAALIRGETAYELQQVPAASGVSYVGRGVNLHGKGVELLVDTNGIEQLACRASDSSFPRTP